MDDAVAVPLLKAVMRGDADCATASDVFRRIRVLRDAAKTKYDYSTSSQDLDVLRNYDELIGFSPRRIAAMLDLPLR
jgi:hypothetical protein